MSDCRTVAILIAAATLACTGSLGGRGEDPTAAPDARSSGTVAGPGAPAAPPGTPGVPLPDPPVPPSVETARACRTIDPGAAPLKRLTRFEYANTVRDLLGVSESPSMAFA